MAAEVLDARDAAVAAIVAAWTDKTDADSVGGEYLAPEDFDRVTGRHVLVYPLGYSEQTADRGGASLWFPKIGITYFERYSERGPPPAAWLDERVTFGREKIFETFKNHLPGIDGAVTLEAVVDTVFDTQLLNSNRVFWSEMEFSFRMLV